MATDFAIILGSFSLALYFRRYNLGRESQGFQFLPEMVLMMIYAGAMIVVFSALGMYQRKTWLSRLWHLGGIVKGTVFTLGGYFLLRGMAKELYLVPSRYVLLLWAVFLFLGLAVHRLLLFPMLIRMASRQGLQRRVVLIGDSPLGHDFVRKWQKLGDRATVNVIGVLTNKGDLRIIREVPILGRIEELAVLVQEYNIEGAVITNPDLSYDELMLLIEECIRLFGWVDVHSDKSVVWHSGSQADFYFDIPFIRMSGVPRNPFYMIYKRTFDVIAASLALLILSPLLLVVIALVRITSPGPVFYIRPRIGQNGRAFPFYKLRSMRVDAEKDSVRREAILAHMAQPDDVVRKVVNPEMITPVGAFIRKWAIDELPQLWNVIRGDMALVGPRPLPLEEYEAQANWHKRRFDIPPGCTGMWKIYAVRSGISFTDTVLYDLYYARNMNPLLDLSILFQTVWVILVGRADG